MSLLAVPAVRPALLALALLPAAGSSGCSDDADGSGTTTSSSTGSGGSTTGTAQGGGGSAAQFMSGTGGAECVTGTQCDGGVCDDTGACCPFVDACGTKCCGGVQVCSFLECVTPGIDCQDENECATGEFCDFSLGDTSGPGQGGGGGAGGGGGGNPGCVGGTAVPIGKCMPEPPICPVGVDPGDPPSCVTSCEYVPPVSAFSPVLKYSWGNPAAVNTADSVMMAPVITQLDDDNCDGVVDERDIPEIVFFTFASGNYNGNGTLHAISIVDGAVVEKWTANSGATSPNHPGRSIAAGNFDGLPGNEIAVCTTDGRVRAYSAAGTQLWLSPTGTCGMPSLADLDQDGDVEVIVESQIIDGETGLAEVAAFTPANTANLVVYDVTGDGVLDLAGPDRVYAADGTLIATTGLGGRYTAIGDFDSDGVPEIAVANYTGHTLTLWHLDPAATGGYVVLRQGIDINGGLSPSLCGSGSAGFTNGGGPPTVADFDGDGVPDLALAGGVGYAVFDGAKLMDPTVADNQTFLWVKQTQDCSSASTGSSVFDFDGDGAAEVVYGDELLMHVYDGATGNVLFETCNTNGTLFEYPLVADVDSDGHADIIVGSNSYSGFNCAGVKTSGIRIFGDLEGKWVRTRRVWNQHAYHVTNVEENGAIPAIEAPNYETVGLNNFRQNVQPSGQFSAPDLVVSITPVCDGPYGLRARVLNIGEAPVEAGVDVGFYDGAPTTGTLLGQVTTTITLYPATHQDLVLPLSAEPIGPVFAVADDGMPPHPWHECRTDNNVSASTSPKCMAPQ